MTGIGEALLDSVPMVALVTDVSHGPGKPSFQVHSLANTAILAPITKAAYEIHHQAEIPSTIHEAFRVARAGEPGPVGVVLPFNFLTEVWDYDGVVPPPYPTAFDEAAYRRAVGLMSNRRLRVGIYAGMGCIDVGPALAQVAEVLQAPVATSVSGKGSIPDAHPLAVGWGYGAPGDPGGGAGVQGRRSRAGRRGEVQRGLDGELRDPQASTTDPRRRQPEEPGPERPGRRLRERRRRRLLRPSPRRRRVPPAPGRPEALEAHPGRSRGRPLREPDDPRRSTASTR